MTIAALQTSSAVASHPGEIRMKFDGPRFARDPADPPTREPRHKQPKVGTAVFDRGHSQSANPEMRTGLGGSTNSVVIRRTARDSQPPRSVVTAILMGDPQPGRVKW